jgi:hypothetical protein
MEVSGDLVAVWLELGEFEAKVELLAGARFDDEQDDAQWCIVASRTNARFTARLCGGETERTFRPSDLRGLPVTLPREDLALRAAITEAAKQARDPDADRAAVLLRQNGHDVARFDPVTLGRLGQLATTIEAGKLPSASIASEVYEFLKEARIYRLGSKLFRSLHDLDRQAVVARIQAATMARLNGETDQALADTEVVATGTLTGATARQTAMLLIVRGHALVTRGRLREATQCVKRVHALVGKDEYVQGLYNTIDAAGG